MYYYKQHPVAGRINVWPLAEPYQSEVTVTYFRNTLYIFLLVTNWYLYFKYGTHMKATSSDTNVVETEQNKSETLTCQKETDIKAKNANR